MISALLSSCAALALGWWLGHRRAAAAPGAVAERPASDLAHYLQRWRPLLDLVPVGVLVIDVEGVVRYANPALGAALRTRPEALIGRDIRAINPDWQSREHLRYAWRELHRRRRLTIDTRHRDANGQIHPVAVHAVHQRAGGDEFSLSVVVERCIEHAAEHDVDQVLDRLNMIECALSNVNLPIAVNDKSGKVLYANPAARRVFGPQSQWPTVRDVYADASLHAGFRAAVDTHPQGVQRTLELIDGRGHRFKADVSSRAISYLGQRCYCSVAIDVSATEAARASEQRSSDRLQIALSGGGVGLFEFEFDSGLLSYSPTAAELLGWRAPQGLSGRHLLAQLSDAGRERAERLFASLRDGASDEWNERLRLRRFDGHNIEVHSRGRRISDADGGPERLVGVISDITAQVAFARRRREAETLERVASLIPAAVYIYDVAEDRLRNINQPALGRINERVADPTLPAARREQLARQRASCDDVHPQDRSIIASHRRSYRSMGDDCTRHLEIRLRDINDHYHRINIAERVFARSEHGEVSAVIGMATEVDDIESVRRHAKALARANAELERFTVIASHDLQEPLRTVSSMSSMLLADEGSSLSEQSQHYLRYIARAATRSQRLIRDLAQYAELRKHDDRRLSPVDSDKALSAALGKCAAAIAASGARIVREPLPALLADALSLSRLFSHLIDNALKYRRAGCAPTLTISAQWAGEALVLRVADDGIGIEPRYREQVFGVFKRLHGREAYEGTGMGLAICARIVEQWQGQIWCEANGERGAVFCFTARPASAPAQARAS